MGNQMQKLSTTQAAKRLGVTVRTLCRWRRDTDENGSPRKGPAFEKQPGKILYPVDFIEEYEQDITVIPKDRKHV
jgi:transposase